MIVDRTDRQSSASPPVVPPLCPSCQAELPNIGWNTMGPVGLVPQEHPSVFVVFFCPHCRVALGCQLVPLTSLLPGGLRPAVVLPGGMGRG